MKISYRFAAIYASLFGIVAVVSFGGWYLGGQHYVNRTHVVKVEKSWGTPDETIAGAQVNEALSALTCDVYGSKNTVVCHP